MAVIGYIDKYRPDQASECLLQSTKTSQVVRLRLKPVRPKNYTVLRLTMLALARLKRSTLDLVSFYMSMAGKWLTRRPKYEFENIQTKQN